MSAIWVSLRDHVKDIIKISESCQPPTASLSRRVQSSRDACICARVLAVHLATVAVFIMFWGRTVLGETIYFPVICVRMKICIVLQNEGLHDASSFKVSSWHMADTKHHALQAPIKESWICGTSYNGPVHSVHLVSFTTESCRESLTYFRLIQRMTRARCL